jgi:hypothetical protein
MGRRNTKFVAQRSIDEIRDINNRVMKNLL